MTKYKRNERLNKSLYWGFFKGGYISPNLIKNKTSKNRSLVQCSFEIEEIPCKSEFVVINTIADPLESLLFNPLRDKKYKFQYWLWEVEKNGKRKRAKETLFRDRKDLENYIYKICKPNILEKIIKFIGM